jgi:uncharacterized protein (DUF885 family)
MEEARSAFDFIRERDLVSLPGGDRIGIVDMPPLLTNRYRDMVYFHPRQGEDREIVSFLYIDMTALPPVRIDRPDIRPTSFVTSEVFPGRHLQAMLAAGSPSIVRQNHEDVFASNGWALYSQDIMAREGFGGETGMLSALERRRFHAAGSIAAINLLLGDFSLEDAAGFMVNETGISGEYARELAIQYALEPELPISYIIGERQIGRIRDEVSRILSDAFTLRAFHDSLLACGPLPLSLVRNNMVSGSVGKR